MIDYLDFSSKIPNKVTDELFIGSYESASDKKILSKLGITHIVVAGSCLTENFPDTFKYFSLDIEDYGNQNISKHFSTSYDFIDEAINNKGKVLVHCAAGISRSSSILIAYLMKKNKVKFDFALSFVKEKRKIVCPNTGFTKQLKFYEKELEKSFK